MSKHRYFRDELTFLKEQGRSFADVHPQLSRFLNGRSTDPDVERLLEGFAFLTGKLREKVDDQFPELTHSMINMLWPNYLRPVPSLSIVQMRPIPGMIDSRQVVPEGTRLHSQPIANTLCQFRTCRDVPVYPLTLEQVSATHSRDKSRVDLSLSLVKNVTVGLSGLDSLRFFLAGDHYSARQLYLWLNHYLERIELVIEQDGQPVVLPLPADYLQPVGFEPEDAVLPYPKNSYDGYRILQEYLCFSDGFLFVDVVGLGQSLPAGLRGQFTLRFCFDRTLPADTRVRNDSFCLYCTPVINLFSHDAQPVDLTGRRSEYPLVPSGQPDHYEIFSVDQVQGLRTRSGQRQPLRYTAFESFQHDIEHRRRREACYYRVRVRESITKNSFEQTIAFIRNDETACIDLDETVTVELTCTNRQLPIALGRGDICHYDVDTPPFVSYSNITEPTEPLRPVLDGSLLWTLISNLSLNYLSLLSKDALCAVLHAYDFRAMEDQQAQRVSQQRLDGIVDIASTPVERLIRGLPVRGLRSRMVLSPSAFSSEGELFLFGTVLSRFFALYASINSFHELEVINADNQERYQWGIQVGQQPLI